MRDKIAQALLRPINTSAIIILGLYTTLWGFWVANPFWSVFDQANVFSVMSMLMPEWAWGSIAIIAGIVILYGVLKPSYRTLTRGALVGTWHWALIGVMYLMGDWMNTGGITSLTFALYAAYVYLNIRVNMVLPDSKKKEGDSVVEEQ